MSDNTFFSNVFDVVRLIPPGRVTSYGAIARYLGNKRGARLVGWALAQAGQYPDVPAHRVVNQAGELSGRAHFSPPEAMQQRLEAEGVAVSNHRVASLQAHFWDPERELA